MLFARGFHGGKQCAQTRGIFPTRARLDAAGNIDSIRFGDSDSLGDILRRQTARQNDPAITPRRTRQIPIERAARTAVQSTRKSVEQDSVSAAKPRKTRRPESSLHLHSFDHAMRPRKRCHFLRRFRTVKLHRMQAQRSRQR